MVPMVDHTMAVQWALSGHLGHLSSTFSRESGQGMVFRT